MGVFELSNRVLAGSLALGLLGALALAQVGLGKAVAAQTNAAQAAQENLAQQSIPNAPKPQTRLPDLGPVTAGLGSASSSADATPGDGAGTPPSASPASPTRPPANGGSKAAEPASTYEPPTGDAANAPTLVVPVSDVNVPFTVKDSKGKLVAGLMSSDIQVFENGVMQRIINFNRGDAVPLSVALVIDQTMTYDNMLRVNAALGALQDAFTKYDEIAVFTYNNGPKTVTDYTGAQSARLTQAIDISKGAGREPLLAGSLSGPLSQTTVINNQNFDPNTSSQRGHTGIQLNPPKEQHTLNDAILAAATTLNNRAVGRRRVIYVISDGKEYGSKAKTKDVIKYLQTNQIEVDGTVVGDSSLPVVGFLDRIHLPLTMQGNILPQYANATGGNLDSEFRTGEIEKSFARIAAEVRNRYTLDYITHEPLIDDKYRTIEVRVINHGNDLTIFAKKGYWPSAVLARPRPAATQ